MTAGAGGVWPSGKGPAGAESWTVRNGTAGEFAAETASADPVTVDYQLVGQVRAAVNEQLDEYLRKAVEPLDPASQRQLALRLISRHLQGVSLQAASAGVPMLSAEAERKVLNAVMAAMFGLGRLEALLAEPEIEDIYVRGTAPVIVKFAGGRQEVREPVADTVDDLMTQLSSIATHHGQNARSVSSVRPWLDMRLPGNARLAAVWGVTPVPMLTIRRHRYVDITLERLVGMGTVSAAMAAFLHAAVLARRSILVVGGQGAGKTTLLRALAQCLARAERFATLETEYELLLHEIPDRFPGLVPFEARQGTGEPGPDGRPTGEVTLADMFPAALRHTLRRAICGEVRSAEVGVMLSCMARGYKGSMATFHANSAEETFDELASLLSEYRPNWSLSAAMLQIATAIDLIVFIDLEDTETGEIRYVSEIMEVGPGLTPSGRPVHNYIFQPREDLAETDPRGYAAGQPQNRLWPRRAGFDTQAWLANPAGSAWSQPFPARWGFT